MRLQPRDLLFAGVALAVAAVCVRLGIWQVDRLHQRRARNAGIAAARARPPIQLTGQGVPADSAHDRRILARGVFDYDHETVWRARSYEDVPGVDLITPLRLPDGSAVLVDRGWVPSPDAMHIDHRAYREGDSADVDGLGMKAPRDRADVDPRTFADSVPYRLLPFVVQQSPPTTASYRPLPPASFIRRWPLPTLDNGPHLSYAIQWFSFATIILVGTVALLLKQRSPSSRSGAGDGG